MVPLTLALLPGFVDGMTALNDDVVAVAVFSVFLWGCVRLVRRDFSWVNLLWATAAAILCYFTKSTSFIALPILLVALLFCTLRGRRRKWAWGLLALGAVIGLGAPFLGRRGRLVPGYVAGGRHASCQPAGCFREICLHPGCSSPGHPELARAHVPAFAA